MKKIFTIMALLLVVLGVVACDGTAEEKFKVSFNTGAANKVIPAQTIKKGSKVNQPNVSFDGHKLDGWFIESTFNESGQWRFSVDVVTKELTLYAKWSEVEGVEGELPDSFIGAADGKHVYITSIGLSSDGGNLYSTLRQYVFTGENEAFEEQVTYDLQLNPATPENDSIVILVVGVSGKGLTGAHTTLQAETTRHNAFLTRASKGDIEIYLVHIGGEDRRGADTDPLLTSAAAIAKLILVQEDGNRDQFFNKFNPSITFFYDYYIDLSVPFKQIFNRVGA